ncbi:MAG: zinc ribbon domain-containing protein [Dehalococcoidales bacterium]|nr:zinc ribbon domain-containing protein [Dehalococcoidales bacterium]
MPIYDYECVDCAHRFEMRRSFSDTSDVSCPRCGCHTQRVFSSVPVIFKGSGFYVNDYPKNSSSGPASTPASPPSGGTNKVKTGTEGK